MVNVVPSLEGSLLLKDPQSIIAYQLRRYFRMPKDTIPILADSIISLPWQVARFGKEPDILASNIQSDLQTVLLRIFGDDRKVTVTTNSISNGDDSFDITISVIYGLANGEITQTGTTISLGSDGRLKIPEDTIRPNFGLM